jgi:hypothetical protein
MEYNDLWKLWLEARNKKAPSGMEELTQDADNPGYFLASDDIQQVINAFSPLDLYLRPDNAPRKPYKPTVAATLNRMPWNSGIDKAVMLSAEDSPNWYARYYGMGELGNGMPEYMKNYFAQAVYAHELEHARIHPMSKLGITHNENERRSKRAETEFWEQIKRRK